MWCTQEEAATELARISTAWNRLAATMATAKGKGTLVAADQAVADASALQAEIQGYVGTASAKLAMAAQNPLVFSVDFCEIVDTSSRYFQRLQALGSTISQRTGEPNPVPNLEPTPARWGILDYAKLGIVVVAGYYAWKWAKENLFDDGEYPRAKLPRYAGGRRR